MKVEERDGNQCPAESGGDDERKDLSHRVCHVCWKAVARAEAARCQRRPEPRPDLQTFFA